MARFTAPTIAQALRDAAARLAAVSETPRLDAEILLAHALGMRRARLLAEQREVVELPACFEAMLTRRLNYEPIAYILGEWEFYGLRLHTRAPVLTPRPETEHLVDVALRHLKGLPSPRVLDLCTGSGCVALTIAANMPNAGVTATDQSVQALELAAENARLLELSLQLYQGDLFAALPADAPPFDAIVSNPPYVEEADWAELSPVITRHEDPAALLAGADGLDLIRRIIAEAPRFLQPGGLLALEMGEKHWPEVQRLLKEARYAHINVEKDLAGIPRIAFARKD